MDNTTKTNKDKIEEKDAQYIDMNKKFKKFLTTFVINESSQYPEI